jgi:hypothetical protein
MHTLGAHRTVKIPVSGLERRHVRARSAVAPLPKSRCDKAVRVVCQSGGQSGSTGAFGGFVIDAPSSLGG